METTEILFNNKKMNPEKLLSFGFVKDGKGYAYSAALLEGQFEAIVTVSEDGHVTADVVDALTKEIYVLVRVREATGAFVGKVRSEYEELLGTIAEQCFDFDIFKNEYVKKVVKYIKSKYNDEPEFLWPKFPKNAIFRRKDSSKWYAALLNLPKYKIGLSGEGDIDIIDLRIDTQLIDSLIDGKKYFLGFHMNKKHWFTMCLDGSVDMEEVCDWIDTSYSRARK